LELEAYFLFNFRLNFSDPRSSEAVGWFPTIPLHAGSGIRCNCYSPALNRVSITQPDPRSMLFAQVAVHTQALITWIRDQFWLLHWIHKCFISTTRSCPKWFGKF